MQTTTTTTTPTPKGGSDPQVENRCFRTSTKIPALYLCGRAFSSREMRNGRQSVCQENSRLRDSSAPGPDHTWGTWFALSSAYPCQVLEHTLIQASSSVPGCFMLEVSDGEFTLAKSAFPGPEFCEHSTCKSRLPSRWWLLDSEKLCR